MERQHRNLPYPLLLLSSGKVVAARSNERELSGVVGALVVEWPMRMSRRRNGLREHVQPARRRIRVRNAPEHTFRVRMLHMHERARRIAHFRPSRHELLQLPFVTPVCRHDVHAMHGDGAHPSVQVHAKYPAHDLVRIGHHQPWHLRDASFFREPLRSRHITVSENRNKRNTWRHCAFPRLGERLELMDIAEIGHVSAVNHGVNALVTQKGESASEFLNRFGARNMRIRYYAEPNRRDAACNSLSSPAAEPCRDSKPDEIPSCHNHPF